MMVKSTFSRSLSLSLSMLVVLKPFFRETIETQSSIHVSWFTDFNSYLHSAKSYLKCAVECFWHDSNETAANTF
jgi:hypothetical protein